MFIGSEAERQMSQYLQADDNAPAISIHEPPVTEDDTARLIPITAQPSEIEALWACVGTLARKVDALTARIEAQEGDGR